MKTVAKKTLRKYGIFGAARYCFHLLKSVRARLKRLLRDGSKIRTYLSSHEVKKLHLGAGSNSLPGWLNSDLDPSLSSDVIYLDATKPFPVKDCIFDYVFSEHMIEHVTYPEGLHMLKECHRVLKPGGKIRIATPDLLFLIELYQPNKTGLQKAYIRWSTDVHDEIQSRGSYEDTFVINNFMKAWGHRFIYDEKVLRRTLEKAGFSFVVRRGLHESEDEELRGLENQARMPAGFLDLETMVLEAEKLGIDT